MCFLQVAEKNNIYKCVLSNHRTEIVLKKLQQRKKNNYTYISYTSKWLLLAEFFPGGNLLRIVFTD